MPVVWPLTGRSKELRLIEAAISDRESSGIVIYGEAGVGKSRMAREALSAAASKGYDVRWIVGTSSARSIPLGALASWAGPGDVGLDLVRGVIAALTATSAGKAAVLGIDDVPLLDDLSTFVVHQIISQRTAKVVLTVRDGDLVPPATQELWQGGQFERLDLEPLSRGDTAALVSAAVGGPLDPYAAERLWQLTQGNVLYLRNIVEYEATHERLALRDGIWQWSNELIVPPSLIEAVEARIGDLPPPVADVIDTLAVGEPLEFNSLTNITNAAAVEEADGRGLIIVEPVEGGLEVRVAHPLYGEVRRNRAASTRLRRLRGAVANELAAGKPDSDARLLVRRAALTLDSDLEPDPDLLVRGAERAIWLGDWLLAERLSEAAYRVSGGPDAIRVLAHLYSMSGRGEQADRLLADIDTTQMSDDARGAFAFMRSGIRLFGLGDPEGAKKVLDDGIDSVSRGSRTSIDAARAVYAAATGDAPEAQDLLKMLAFDDLPDHVVGQIANMGSAILGVAGRTSEAITLAQNGRARVATSLDSAVVRFGIGDSYVRALVLAGRIPEAFEVTERLRQEAMEVPRVGPLLAVAMACRATLGAGHIQAACGMLEPIVTTLAFMAESVGMTYQYLLMQAMALGMAGSTEKAVAALTAADQRGTALGCVTRADALAQRFGADTPALREAAEPIPLTDREREVVTLLVSGLSVREVAERLTLSLRTVEGHVYRAMTKTGTTSRQELMALLSHRAPESR